MDLYINGNDLGGFYVGTSDYPISSNWPADVAKIGYWHSNGQTLHFRGRMDEVRLWDYSRSQSQIREYMCKNLKSNEAGLIGHWNFNETSDPVLYDKSSNSFNGQLKGNPSRLFSGAPIGDESIYQYTGSWSNFSLAMISGSDQLIAHKIQGNPEGIHLYKVNALPSQTSGLDLSVIEKPYFGVFVAAIDGDNSFNLTYLVNGQPTCKSLARNNNSNPSWNELVSGLESKIGWRSLQY